MSACASPPHTEQRSRYSKRPVEGDSKLTRNFLSMFLLFLGQHSFPSVALHHQSDEKWGKEETGEGLGKVLQWSGQRSERAQLTVLAPGDSEPLDRYGLVRSGIMRNG